MLVALAGPGEVPGEGEVLYAPEDELSSLSWFNMEMRLPLVVIRSNPMALIVMDVDMMIWRMRGSFYMSHGYFVDLSHLSLLFPALLLVKGAPLLILQQV